MSWLKKVGTILLRGIEIVNGIAPVAEYARPNQTDVIERVLGELAQLKQIIVATEAMGQALGLPGADKLRAAAPMVAQIMLTSSAMVGHSVGDEPKFYGGCTKIADGMADCLNALKADVSSVSKAA